MLESTEPLDGSAITLLWSSFLLRFYREGENGAWRGEIIHAQTKEKQRIGNAAQLYEFLLKHLPDFEQNSPPSNPTASDMGYLSDHPQEYPFRVQLDDP